MDMNMRKVFAVCLAIFVAGLVLIVASCVPPPPPCDIPWSEEAARQRAETGVTPRELPEDKGRLILDGINAVGHPSAIRADVLYYYAVFRNKPVYGISLVERGCFIMRVEVDQGALLRMITIGMGAVDDAGN
jgi:hypothetical protein